MDLLPGDFMIPGPIKMKQLQAILSWSRLCAHLLFLSIFFFSTYFLYVLLFVVSPVTQILLFYISLFFHHSLSSSTVYPCVWNGLNGWIQAHSASPVDLSGWMSFGMNRRDTTQIRMISLHVCVHLCVWTSLFVCI